MNMLSRASSFDHEETSPVQLPISELITASVHGVRDPLNCSQGPSLYIVFKHASTGLGGQARALTVYKDNAAVIYVPLELLGRETQQLISLQNARGFLPTLEQYPILALIQGLAVIMRFKTDGGMSSYFKMTFASVSDYQAATDQFRRYGCPMKEKTEARPNSRNNVQSTGAANPQTSATRIPDVQPAPPPASSFNTLSQSSSINFAPVSSTPPESYGTGSTFSSMDFRQGALNKGFQSGNYGIRPPSSGRPASPLKQVQNSLQQDIAHEITGLPSSSKPSSSSMHTPSFNPTRNTTDQYLFNFGHPQEQTERPISIYQNNERSSVYLHSNNRPSTAPFIQRSPFFPALVDQNLGSDSDRPCSSHVTSSPRSGLCEANVLPVSANQHAENNTSTETFVDAPSSQTEVPETQTTKRKVNRRTPGTAPKRSRGASGDATAAGAARLAEDGDTNNASDPASQNQRPKSRTRPPSRAKTKKTGGTEVSTDDNAKNNELLPNQPSKSTTALHQTVTDTFEGSENRLANPAASGSSTQVIRPAMPPPSGPGNPLSKDVEITSSSSQPRSPLSEIRSTELAQNALFLTQPVEVQEAAIEESIIDALRNPEFPDLLNRVKGVWRRIGLEGWADSD